MLRDLGQPLERDPQRIHPRKGESDPEDSVFVVYIYAPEADLKSSAPYLASIWLFLGEAKAAADRYAADGHFQFPNGLQLARVMEYQVGTHGPHVEKHHDAVPVKNLSSDQERIAHLEEELMKLRARNAVTDLVGGKPV